MLACVFLAQPVGQFCAGECRPRHLGPASDANSSEAVIAAICIAGFGDNIETNDRAAGSADSLWRLITGLGVLPATVALFFRFTIPESVRYYLFVENNSIKAESFFREQYSMTRDGFLSQLDLGRPAISTDASPFDRGFQPMSTVGKGEVIEMAEQPRPINGQNRSFSLNGPSSTTSPRGVLDPIGPAQPPRLNTNSTSPRFSSEQAELVNISPINDKDISMDPNLNQPPPNGGLSIHVPHSSLSSHLSPHFTNRSTIVSPPVFTNTGDPPRARQWNLEEFKKYLLRDGGLTMLIGTSLTWAALDFAFYGINLSVPNVVALIKGEEGLEAGPTKILNNAINSMLMQSVGALLGSITMITLVNKQSRRSVQFWGFIRLAIAFVIIGPL